ncbi:hypothetical protein K503DRAFT_806703 [Rhizopogon vinicolor AM-OR11-026]|uniref:Uncharacterized protein n=1 Tax=Rhizopogon vinicolor AM-OR11-026 TaxID=1314800 RepID=A0A1B7MDY5_9AGAM|nr:hypothetical protein K503DRAFT_806703 [Rhizopogon vinicolor AM-OR11-026]
MALLSCYTHRGRLPRLLTPLTSNATVNQSHPSGCLLKPFLPLHSQPRHIIFHTSILDFHIPLPPHDLSNLSVPPLATVGLAPKAGVAEIVGRTVNDLKDEAKPYHIIAAEGAITNVQVVGMTQMNSPVKDSQNLNIDTRHEI